MQEKSIRRTQIEQEQESKQNENKNKNKINTKKIANKFNLLNDSDSEDSSDNEKVSEEIIQMNEEFPSLCAVATASYQHEKAYEVSYASMAVKTVEQFENEKFEKKLMENALKKISLSSTEKKALTRFETQTSWAEDNYEEEEEEEEEEAQQQAPVYKIGKASEMNWAMMDDDSDDEW
jgi:hypothetical protein